MGIMENKMETATLYSQSVEEKLRKEKMPQRPSTLPAKIEIANF